ncbi:uncharacterized MFS-type transporter YfiS (plasmid) [Arthrobacter sp. Hiyo8]|nr:uncharacterized MFS-type transporter YfiS [Arthrobacter sp. Hiyo8]
MTDGFRRDCVPRVEDRELSSTVNATTSSGSQPPTGRRPSAAGGPFGALRFGNYRLFLAGQLLSVSGTWTQRVAQDWLVLDLSNGSGVALGLVSAIQYTPMMLLSSWGGLLADRYSKRLLLVITQSLLALTAAALGLLALAGQLTLTHVYVLAGVMGIATALDNPTRQSFLIELVGRDHLPAAVGLNSATFNVSRMIGPAIGGALIVLVGAGPAFLVNAASFLAVIASVALMRRESLFVEPPRSRPEGKSGPGGHTSSRTGGSGPRSDSSLSPRRSP